MLASEIIEEAREFHMTFNALAHPSTMLLRALHRAEARFFDLVTNLSGSDLATEIVYDTADIAAGVLGGALTIPAYRALKPLGILVRPDGIFPVSITSDEESMGRNPVSVRVVGRSLYIAQSTAFLAEMPADISESLTDNSVFADATALRLTYVPSPVPYTGLGDTLVAPDDARRFLQGELVSFMANRGTGIDASDKRDLKANAMMMQEEVLDFYANRAGGETRWYVSEIG